MAQQWLLPTIIITSLLLKGTHQGADQKALLKYIFDEKGYAVAERPSENDSLSLMVYLKFSLQQIIDVDEKNQMLNTNAWLSFAWNDYALSWDKHRFGGIRQIILAPKYIWRPDVFLYNSVHESFDSTYSANVVISDSGDVVFIPPGIFKSSCSIDTTWFPFDEQFCKMKFGSWTHGGLKINLSISPEGATDTSTYVESGEWDLLEVLSKRTVQRYKCCPEEPYIDITYTIHIRRRTLYVGFNLIFPCVLISSLVILVFSTPSEAGEKVSLGVTILLSLTVFLQLVFDSTPPTVDSFPITGIYFACIMVMCSSSVYFAVLVVNFHHRNPKTHIMPKLVKKLICEWLAWVLRMSRPGKEFPIYVANTSSKHKLKSSKSLLMNVLDLEDYICRNVKYEDDFLQSSEVQTIVKEVKFITGRMKTEDVFSEALSDWRFAAAVMDRLCLWIFSILTITITLATNLAAPNFP